MEDRPLILESFDMNLPRLSNRSEEVKYHQLSALLTTTQACIPPYLLLCRDASINNGFIDLAESTLQKLRENAPFGDTRLPFAFPEMAMDTEADFVSATESQLLQPINEILHRRWNGRWTLRREYSPNSSMQFDLVYEKKSMAGEEKERILVLELERRELITYYDFAPEELKEDEKGLMKYGSSATDVENRIDTIKDLAGRTAWVGNATPFLKQVSKYANGDKGCPYVALFNWDHLLLFKFKENDLGRKKRRGMTTAGDTAELTWITEGTAVHNCDRGPYIQTGKFRRAMLGFVVGAFEAKFGR